MRQLPENWLTEGIIDFEYKKYVLLAYMQHVKRQFSHHMLFPELNEVRTHYRHCKMLISSKQAIRESFPKNPVGVDVKKMQFTYVDSYQEDSHLSELSDIIGYAMPVFSDAVEEGQERYRAIEEALSFSPVGILPLRNEEGYLFIYRASSKEMAVYAYRIALFDGQEERTMYTVHVDTFYKNAGTTFEHIKVNLTRKFTHMPNPAAYLVESGEDYPLNETLLPLARKLVLQNLSFT